MINFRKFAFKLAFIVGNVGNDEQAEAGDAVIGRLRIEILLPQGGDALRVGIVLAHQSLFFVQVDVGQRLAHVDCERAQAELARFDILLF